MITTTSEHRMAATDLDELIRIHQMEIARLEASLCGQDGEVCECIAASIEENKARVLEFRQERAQLPR